MRTTQTASETTAIALKVLLADILIKSVQARKKHFLKDLMTFSTAITHFRIAVPILTQFALAISLMVFVTQTVAVQCACGMGGIAMTGMRPIN